MVTVTETEIKKDFSVNPIRNSFEWFNTNLLSPWSNQTESASVLTETSNEFLFILSSDINPLV